MRDVESVNLAPPSNLRFLLGGARGMQNRLKIKKFAEKKKVEKFIQEKSNLQIRS